jgi:hypothetical protein
MTGEDRRKNDEEFKQKMTAFMSRIDQRNIDRDIAHAAQEETSVCHEERITSLEHTRTQFKTMGLGIPAFGSMAWACFKIGQAFKDMK